MSQSSEESANLLSPPPEPVAIVRGAHGLLTVPECTGGEGEESKTERDSVSSRVGCEGIRDEGESNQMLGSACKRISTEAAFASAKRRRRSRGPAPRDDVESPADQSKSPARKEAATTANWRNYIKSYKSTKPTTSPDKDSPPGSDPNHSSTNNVETAENSPKEATTEAKRPSSEFRNTYLPHAPSRRSALNILNTSKDIETAMILNKEIVVPGEGGADASNQEEYNGLSQITMACTQAFVGCPVDEEDNAEGVLANDDDTDIKQDVFEYENSAKKQPRTEDGSEKFSVLSRADLDNDHMAIDTPAGYGLGKLDEGEINDANEQSSAGRKSDVFEFKEGDDATKSKSKPLPPVAYAAAKKRKKGPTDKALLEEDYESSQRSKSLAHMANVDVFDAASGQSKEEQPNGTNLDVSSPKQTREETILKNYTAIEAMGKAMSCPICCHSFKSAKCLPCGHAFCHGCLTSALKTSLTCPICRKPCNRRSGKPMQQLDDIVNGYKQVSRAFGFAPVVHSKSVTMTQLSPENDCFDYEEREGKVVGLKKRRLLGVDEALEHHQIAQSNHEAFASFQKLQAPPPTGAAAQKSSGSRMTREELEQLNLTRRYQLLANDQAAVMQADKEALEKAMKKKVMLAEATLEFAGIKNVESKCDLQEDSKDDLHDNKKTAASAGDVEADMDTKSKLMDVMLSEEHQKMPSAVAPKESQDTFYTSNNQVAGKKDSAAIPPAIPPIESQETFHTAKSEHTRETQPPRESVATAPSPTIIRDGNTVKKGRTEELEAELVDNNRHSLATVESTVVIHDGNTVEKKKTETDQTPRRSGKYLPLSAEADDQDATDAESSYDNGDTNKDAELVGGESHQSPIISERTESTSPEKTKPSSSSENREIVVGSIVLVQARTWPGINKQGGVGRVTKINSTGGSNKYDVAYVLGGKDKAVDELYVSLNEAEQSEENDNTVGARVSRSAEKKPVRKRTNQRKKNEPPSSNAIPIYNDMYLQHIPEDVLEWAGIKPRPTANKKRVLADSKGNTAKPKKLKKPNTSSKRTTSKPDGQACENMSVDQLVICADQRYSLLLEGATLHVVTSSLSDADTKQLNSLTKMLKGGGITLKIMKDFKPDKTQLCITSATTDSSHKHNEVNRCLNIVSKSRTLKIMRSALYGIPILSPRWMSECIKQKRIVPPSGPMCIRTLPRKTATENDTDASFGVAKCVAAVCRNQKILRNCSVFLCGQWKSTGGQNTIKDLKVLLEDAGATIMKSVAVASKLLANNESSDNLIFLCDDSHLDEDCGVPENLFQAGKECKLLTVVHFHWLFDCVSCAKLVPGEAYEPLAPRTKDLWRMNCTSNDSERA